MLICRGYDVESDFFEKFLENLVINDAVNMLIAVGIIGNQPPDCHSMMKHVPPITTSRVPIARTM